MGCIFCNITNVKYFGAEEKPQPNPFYCKERWELKQFLDELASDIVSRHPEFLKLLNTLAANRNA